LYILNPNIAPNNVFGRLEAYFTYFFSSAPGRVASPLPAEISIFP